MGSNPSKLIIGPGIGETLQSMGLKNSFVELPPVNGGSYSIAIIVTAETRNQNA